MIFKRRRNLYLAVRGNEQAYILALNECDARRLLTDPNEWKLQRISMRHSVALSYKRVEYDIQ